MQCIAPRTCGYSHDGKTLTWSEKNFSKEFATFQIPCGKCLPCRLNYAQEWSIRCVHEAAMHDKNCFITLTYSDEKLLSDRLQYSDFQLFIKRLRDHIFQDFLKTYGRANWNLLSKPEKKELYDKIRIGVFVTGEYGDLTKRPHWHALIFNWEPSDKKYHYSNGNKDKVYTSDTLSKLWQNGHAELGELTKNSANYCARYAAKKLTHGRDQDHDYHPISKKSSKQAIGKRWIEKHHEFVFTFGKINLADGTTAPIPRYYEKWLKANKPELFSRYVTNKKLELQQKCEAKKQQVQNEYDTDRQKLPWYYPTPITRLESEYIILKQKFNRLQDKLKL